MVGKNTESIERIKLKSVFYGIEKKDFEDHDDFDIRNERIRWNVVFL